MRRLFILECKKIVTSVVYWLFVAAMAVVFLLNYGDVDEEQIADDSSPCSLFYCAKDGKYADEQDHLSGKDGQNQMMQGLTKKLLHSYQNNSYEYYPFDYIKIKVFSDSEQKMVLKYLQEITGMKEKEILTGTGETTDTIPEQTEASGEGQYIAEPGTGNRENERSRAI